MGICLTAKNSSISFDMSYGGFFNMRKNIALALDKEFGENYSLLASCHSEEEYAENDRKAMEIINGKHLDDEYSDVLDFLYASDAEGKMSYKTAGKIYRLIKDVDFGNKIFVYATHSKGKDYEDLKLFLKECYSKRRNAVWY